MLLSMVVENNSNWHQLRIISMLRKNKIMFQINCKTPVDKKRRVLINITN